MWPTRNQYKSNGWRQNASAIGASWEIESDCPGSQNHFFGVRTQKERTKLMRVTPRSRPWAPAQAWTEAQIILFGYAGPVCHGTQDLN